MEQQDANTQTTISMLMRKQLEEIIDNYMVEEIKKHETQCNMMIANMKTKYEHTKTQVEINNLINEAVWTWLFEINYNLKDDDCPLIIFWKYIIKNYKEFCDTFFEKINSLELLDMIDLISNVYDVEDSQGFLYDFRQINDNDAKLAFLLLHYTEEYTKKIEFDSEIHETCGDLHKYILNIINIRVDLK